MTIITRGKTGKMSLRPGRRELRSGLLVLIVKRLVRNVVIQGESHFFFFFQLYDPLHIGFTTHPI